MIKQLDIRISKNAKKLLVIQTPSYKVGGMPYSFHSGLQSAC